MMTENAIKQMVVGLDLEYMLHKSNTGAVVRSSSPILDAGQKIFAGECTNYFNRYLSIDTQDVLMHVHNNNDTIKKMSNFIENQNVHDPKIEENLLYMSKKYGSSLSALLNKNLQNNGELRSLDVVTYLDNQRALAKDSLALLKIKHPKLSSAIEANMKLDKFEDMYKHIGQVAESPMAVRKGGGFGMRR